MSKCVLVPRVQVHHYLLDDQLVNTDWVPLEFVAAVQAKLGQLLANHIHLTFISSSIYVHAILGRLTRLD